jgi:hypothetical protein
MTGHAPFTVLKHPCNFPLFQHFPLRKRLALTVRRQPPNALSIHADEH